MLSTFHILLKRSGLIRLDIQNLAIFQKQKKEKFFLRTTESANMEIYGTEIFTLSFYDRNQKF